MTADRNSRTGSGAPGPRWRRRREARPGEILEAALQVFVQRGFAQARMEEIARRAGVTKGTVYLYFASKEELFRAVVRETITPQLELIERIVAEHRGSAAELFRQLVRRWWTVVGETELARLPKLMVAEAANFPELAEFFVREVVQRARGIVGGVLRRGIAAGEFREVDVEAAVRLAVAPLLAAAIYRHSLLPCDSEPWDFQKYLDLHVEFFLRGIARAEASHD